MNGWCLLVMWPEAGTAKEGREVGEMPDGVEEPPRKNYDRPGLDSLFAVRGSVVQSGTYRSSRVGAERKRKCRRGHKRVRTTERGVCESNGGGGRGCAHMVVAGTVANEIISDAILDARARVREGDVISEPLRKSKMFPPMVVQMIAIGQESGALDTMLSKIADCPDLTIPVSELSILALVSLVGCCCCCCCCSSS